MRKRTFLKEIENRLATGQIFRWEVMNLKGMDISIPVKKTKGESK